MTLIFCDLSLDQVQLAADSCRLIGGAGPVQVRTDARKLVRRNGLVVAIAGDWVLAPDPLAPECWIEAWLAGIDVRSGVRAAGHKLAEALEQATPLAHSKGGSLLIAGCEAGTATVMELTGASRSTKDIRLNLHVREHAGPLGEPLVRGLFCSWAQVMALSGVDDRTMRSAGFDRLILELAAKLASEGKIGVSGPAHTEIVTCAGPGAALLDA
jgi:hypothetical protein